MSGKAKQPVASSRMATYFVPGTGIDREVITTDICRYLGNDALVRPGNYTNEAGQTMAGFYVTAYRALTSDQLADIKADSARWANERAKNPASIRGQPSGGGYGSSATRARQQWGQESSIPPGPAAYANPNNNPGPPNPALGGYNQDYNRPNQPPVDYGRGQPEYGANANYSYGAPVMYGAQSGNPAQPPRTTGFSNNAPYQGDGRGAPNYPPERDNRNPQPNYGYADPATNLGRGPMNAAQPPYGVAPQDPYYNGRGPQDESMDYDYDQEDYADPPMANPPPTTGASRPREREPESRRSGKHGRR